MAERSIKHNVGMLYDIQVKAYKFIFFDDFVMLDRDTDVDIPIILGLPFLKCGRVLVDVERGKLKFWVNDDEVTFNNFKSMKQPRDII